MSTEAADSGPAGGGAAVSRRHTCEDGSQGRPQPGEEGPSCGDTCGGEDGAAGGSSCKPQAMHSNSSSETCIPTPSCRICFQGAEQVGDGPVLDRTRTRTTHWCCGCAEQGHANPDIRAVNAQLPL